MVAVDKAVIARLKSSGETFEILVDPDLALDYRGGKEVDMNDILAVKEIFKDAKKGERASEELMIKLFSTSGVSEVADRILKKGEIQLTTEQKKRMLDEKKKKVVNIIARNAINPQTNVPHPPARIEEAMEEAKVHIKLSMSAEEQVDNVVKALRPILPLKFEKRTIAIKIPVEYSARLYGILKEFGEVKKEEYVGNYQYCLLEIPAGLQDDLYNKLNNLTHGNVETKIV